MNRVKYRALIFDLDGTLVHTRDVYPVAYNTVLEPYLGRPFPKEELVSIQAVSEKRPFEARVAEDDRPRIKAQFPKAYAEAFDQFARPWDPWKDWLQPLAERVPLAVFTGKSRYTARYTLEKMELTDSFSWVVTEDDVENPKPAPDGLHLVCEKLSIPTGEVLYIGDTRSDLRCCRSAGMPMAAVMWYRDDDDYRQKLLADKPDYVFERPEDFFGFISGRLAGKFDAKS